MAGLGFMGLIAGFAVQGASVPDGYPKGYETIIASAEKEGKVVIYSNTELTSVQPIIADFKKIYPKVEIEYLEVKAAQLYSRVTSEFAANVLKADVVWSSSMDLQYKMVNDGIAQVYESAEGKVIPKWANYKNTLYGITFEPVVMAYNKKLLSEADAPKNHADLLKLLTTKTAEMQGKLATFDPQLSGYGYFVHSRDVHLNKDFWNLVKAFGATKSKFYSATGQMLEKVSSGEHAITYNIVGPYAYLKAIEDPNVVVVVSNDYTQILTRSAFITKPAEHPNAAKLFIDYMLSKRGQHVVANEANLFSMRPDVQGVATAAKLTAERGSALKTVAIDDKLDDDLDENKRKEFFAKWKASLEGK